MKEIIISVEHREEMLEYLKEYGEIMFDSKRLNIIALKPFKDDFSFLNHRFVNYFYDYNKRQIISNQ